MAGGTFGSVVFSILGHIWLNLSKIGDIDISPLSEPSKKITLKVEEANLNFLALQLTINKLELQWIKVECSDVG